MEDEIRISPVKDVLPTIRRNVVTSYSNHHNNCYKQHQQVKKGTRSYSENLVHLTEEAVYSHLDSEQNVWKPPSPSAPATTPSPQHSVTTPFAALHSDYRSPFYWKDVLAQITPNRKKAGAMIRSCADDVRVIEHKYARFSKQKSLLQVPSVTPGTTAHHLKPLEVKQEVSEGKNRKKKAKKHRELDVSGNRLASQYADKQQNNKDYVPGCIKTQLHGCYKCVNRMSAHDHHSFMESFHLSCRARKGISTKATASGEPFLCVNGSKGYYDTNTDFEISTSLDSSSRFIEANGVVDIPSNTGALVETACNPKEQKQSRSRIDRNGGNKWRSIIRAGKVLDKKSFIADHEKLASLIRTVPINIMLIKYLDINACPPTLPQKTKPVLLAIKCKPTENDPKNDIVPTEFAMITQGEGLLSNTKEDSVRDFTFSVMDEAQNLFRPDSIMSVTDKVEEFSKLPILVFSDSDLSGHPEGKGLNKNTSAIENNKSPGHSPYYWTSHDEFVNTDKVLRHKDPQQSKSSQIKQYDTLLQHPELSTDDVDDLEEDEDYDDEDESVLFYKLKHNPNRYDKNAGLPTGKFLCYTAMTDKRYNKWSRQIKKPGKRKSKKHHHSIEDKEKSATNIIRESQEEDYIKSIENAYKNFEGVLKYKHDHPRETLKTNKITISKPDIFDNLRNNLILSSKQSDVCGESRERSRCCMAPMYNLIENDVIDALQSSRGKEPSSCSELPSTIQDTHEFDDDYEDELNGLLLCNKSTYTAVEDSRHQHESRQPCQHSRLSREQFHEEPNDESETDSASTSPNLEENESPIPTKEVSTDQSAKRPDTPQANISQLQKEIIGYYRNDLLYKNSFSYFCPLSFRLPQMEMQITGKGQGGYTRSANSKILRSNGSRRHPNSPKPIPRIFTGFRNTDTSNLFSLVKGKKTNTTKNVKSKPCKRRTNHDGVEAITIKDLLSNLTINNRECPKKKKTMTSKTVCSSPSFREIYGKSPYYSRNTCDKRGRDGTISSLSFTRSATISVLPLPNVYKIEE